MRSGTPQNLSQLRADDYPGIQPTNLWEHQPNCHHGLAPGLYLKKGIAAFKEIAAGHGIPLRIRGVRLPLVSQEFPNIVGHVEQAISIRGIASHDGGCADGTIRIVRAMLFDSCVPQGKNPCNLTRAACVHSASVGRRFPTHWQ